jgi:DNA-binding MarR family transcriptional regulator
MKENLSYKPLIENWEEYLRKGGDASMKQFATYLLEKEQERTSEKSSVWSNEQIQEYIEQNAKEHHFKLQSPQAATLIWRLYKFIRLYTKPVIQQAGLASNDEFAILATVDAVKECSKKAAITENLIEFSTGMDMIRRLVKAGLLVEKSNKEDKREKLISLSAEGKQLLFAIYEKFSTIQDVLGELPYQERGILIDYLKNLDRFHTSNLGLKHE